MSTDLTVDRPRFRPVMVSRVPPATGPYNGLTSSTEMSCTDTAGPVTPVSTAGPVPPVWNGGPVPPVWNGPVAPVWDGPVAPVCDGPVAPV